MKIVNFNLDGLRLKGISDEVQGGIEFDNGWIMCDCHYQDCCESVFADWNHLKDEAGINYDFNEETFRIEGVDEGIRFGDNGVMFFVPCYNEQNGYYNSDLVIQMYRKRPDGSYIRLRRFSVSAGTIDNIY